MKTTLMKDGKYHVRERRFGSFARSITMPELIDADKINASSDNGVLIVHPAPTRDPAAERFKFRLIPRNPARKSSTQASKLNCN